MDSWVAINVRGALGLDDSNDSGFVRLVVATSQYDRLLVWEL